MEKHADCAEVQAGSLAATSRVVYPLKSSETVVQEAGLTRSGGLLAEAVAASIALRCVENGWSVSSTWFIGQSWRKCCAFWLWLQPRVAMPSCAGGVRAGKQVVQSEQLWLVVSGS